MPQEPYYILCTPKNQVGILGGYIIKDIKVPNIKVTVPDIKVEKEEDIKVQVPKIIIKENNESEDK